jgi:hypothetical protein
LLCAAKTAAGRTTTMTYDNESASWDELELDELHELLAGEIPTLSPEQTAEIAELLSAAGGIDAARHMLEQLAAAPRENRSAA